MGTAQFLFEMEPYTVRPRRRRRPPMPVGVRCALARLKKTMDAIPAEEMATRQRRWRELVGSTRRG